MRIVRLYHQAPLSHISAGKNDQAANDLLSMEIQHEGNMKGI